MNYRYVVLISVACFASPSLIVAESTAAKKELLAADKAAAAVAATSDIDRILEIWSDDAIISFPGRPKVIGKKAIHKMVLANRAQPGFKITWTPSDGHVVSSNELGCTFGIFSITRRGPDGKPLKIAGDYICIWKKVNGQWKCSYEVSQFHAGRGEKSRAATANNGATN